MLDNAKVLAKDDKPLTNNIVKPTIKSELKKKVELIRKKRTPLVAQKRLINFPKDSEYTYRWVNDTEGNIHRYQKAGWEHVDTKGKELEVDQSFQDASWRQSALSQKVGGGITAYVMRIPKEIYDEDQERKFKDSMDYERQLKLKELNEGYKIKGNVKADFGKLTE
jgi:hypothetical protein